MEGEATVRRAEDIENQDQDNAIVFKKNCMSKINPDVRAEDPIS